VLHEPPHPSPPSGRLFGTGELAELLGVSASTIRKWIDYGLKDPAGRIHRLSARAVGKRHKVTWADYEAWQARVSGRGPAEPIPSPAELRRAAAKAAAELAARKRRRY
jgi:MerR family regulatory protein